MSFTFIICIPNVTINIYVHEHIRACTSVRTLTVTKHKKMKAVFKNEGNWLASVTEDGLQVWFDQGCSSVTVRLAELCPLQAVFPPPCLHVGHQGSHRAEPPAHLGAASESFPLRAKQRFAKPSLSKLLIPFHFYFYGRRRISSPLVQPLLGAAGL